MTNVADWGQRNRGGRGSGGKVGNVTADKTQAYGEVHGEKVRGGREEGQATREQTGNRRVG